MFMSALAWHTGLNTTNLKQLFPEARAALKIFHFELHEQYHVREMYSHLQMCNIFRQPIERVLFCS